MLFLCKCVALAGLGVSPRLRAAPEVPVTTLAEILLNQLAEED